MREIARAFRLGAGEQPGLRDMLKMECAKRGLPCIAVLTNVVTELSTYLGLETHALPGKQHELNSLRAKIAATPAPALVTPSSVPGLGPGMRQAAVTGLVQNRLAWDDFLKAFSKVLPEMEAVPKML